MADSDDPMLREDLFQATQDFARRKVQGITEHPSEQDILDYQEGRLDSVRTETLRQHLSLCRPCADEVLELEEWDSSVPEDLTTFPIPPSMHSRRLAFEQQVARVSGTRETVRRRWQLPLSLAAGWAATSFILGILLGSLGSGDHTPDRSHLLAPTARPFLADLLPDGSTPVRTVREPGVIVPEGTNPLVLRLNIGDPDLYDGYRAELVSAAGEAVWRQEGLVPQPGGSFVVLIDLEEVGSGAYRLVLLRQAAGTEAQLAVYSFELKYAAPP